MEGACSAWLCGICSISNSITEGAYSKCLCKPTFRCGKVLKWLGPSYYELLIIHNIIVICIKIVLVMTTIM